MKIVCENRYFNFFLFCIYIIIFRSAICCLCCPKTVFKILFKPDFLLNFSKSWCISGFKREKLWNLLLIVFCTCCNKESMCLQFFFFVEPGSKSEKNVYQWWLLCKQIYFIQGGFFNGFFDLSAKQRFDDFHVPQNFTAFSFKKNIKSLLCQKRSLPKAGF